MKIARCVLHPATGLVLAACLGSPPPAPPVIPTGPVTAVVVDDHGVTLACRTNSLELDGRAIATAPGRALAAAAMSHGTFVLVGGEPARSGWIRQLSADGALSPLERIADDAVLTVAVTAAGRVATGDMDGQVRLDGRGVARHSGPCMALAFADGDHTLLSGGRDGRLLLVDLATGDTRELLDHTAGIECLAVDADDRFASGARDGRVRLHDLDGRLRRTWQRLGAIPMALLARTDGFVVGLDDGRVLSLAIDGDEPLPLHDANVPIHAMARRGEELLLGLHVGLAAIPWPRD